MVDSQTLSTIVDPDIQRDLEVQQLKQQPQFVAIFSEKFHRCVDVLLNVDYGFPARWVRRKPQGRSKDGGNATLQTHDNKPVALTSLMASCIAEKNL